MNRHVTGISSMATRALLAELGQGYEETGGCGVAITSVGGVDAAKRVRGGEVTDVVVLAAKVMADLEREGHLVAGARQDLAVSRVALAVPSGSHHPEIADEAAVRQAILDASRICYSTGPSGDYLKGLIEDWGLTDRMAGRLVQAPPGVSVGSLLARGEAELGLQQLSEFMNLPGIEIVGTLPAAMAATTMFTAGLSRTAAQPDEARAFLAYLASPETAEAKRRHGMEPA